MRSKEPPKRKERVYDQRAAIDRGRKTEGSSKELDEVLQNLF